MVIGIIGTVSAPRIERSLRKINRALLEKTICKIIGLSVEEFIKSSPLTSENYGIWLWRIGGSTMAFVSFIFLILVINQWVG
jgi:hypothetical protein